MFRELLKQRIPGLRSEQLDRLESHFNLLLRWNRVINLTRIVEPVAVVERHYCESLFLAFSLPGVVEKVVDLGSGAGFPGVPVAVALEAVQVTLVEANRRKAAFLKEATRGWPNVRVIWGRAEALEGGFQWAVSRAVRWEEIEAAAARVAAGAAVLGGAECPGGRMFEWAPGLRVPWGERRFLYLGRKVSRGTFARVLR